MFIILEYWDKLPSICIYAFVKYFLYLHSLLTKIVSKTSRNTELYGMWWALLGCKKSVFRHKYLVSIASASVDSPMDFTFNHIYPFYAWECHAER